MTDAVIQMHDVTKRFGDKTVLDRLNYTLRKGTVTGLLGKNGSGKTTLESHQRGQVSLFRPCFGNRTRGLPLGRMVDSSFSLLAMDSTQPSSLSGFPRCVESRTAASSAFVRGSLTRAVQPGSLDSGQGARSFGAGSGCCSHRHYDPHRQSSAQCTKPARRALRSTYRQTVRKCSSS